MQAIRIHEFGEPEVMRLEEVAEPEAGPGEVCVQVEAAGINPVDTYIRSGLYPIKPALPYTPGHDAAGTVKAVGPGVRRVKAGDRVYTSGSLTGTCAQITKCLESQVHLLPNGVTSSQGAALGVPYSTAYRALFQRACARAGHLLLVHGATGGVGIASVQLARAAGLTVIGTGGTEKGRKLVLVQGAHHVLDHTREGYLDELTALSDGQGVDLIVEMLANANLKNDLQILSRGGCVVVIGSRGPIEIDPREIMSRDAEVKGMVLFNTPEEDKKEIHAALAAGLQNGTVRPVIGKELPLAQAAQAHRAVMQPGAYGKIVLIP